MPAAIRQGDKCSGHGCWPPRVNTSWSTDVYVNGLGWHRQDDGWEKHNCGDSQHTVVHLHVMREVYLLGRVRFM